jgi:hypothetical protein
MKPTWFPKQSGFRKWLEEKSLARSYQKWGIHRLMDAGLEKTKVNRLENSLRKAKQEENADHTVPARATPVLNQLPV